MIESAGMARVWRALGSAAAWLHDHPTLALLAAGLLTALSLVSARQIRLDADLIALLPSRFQSVQDLERLRERFGGTGYVAVVGRNADPAALRRLADDLAPKLETLPEVRFVDYLRLESFFEERGLYFLPPEDLRTIEDRLAERLRWEKAQKNPLFVDLEGDGPPSLDFLDIERRSEAELERRGAPRTNVGPGRESYYLDPETRTVVLLAKPSGTSGDLEYSKRLVTSVEEVLAGVDRSQYGPNLELQITGTFKKKIDQQTQIGRDVKVASLVAAALVFMVLLLHFRSAAGLIVAAIPLGAGLAWTYGLVALLYGTVNILTAFLGAILGGLGIEHGIHLLGRYRALRSHGHASVDATREAFVHTGGPALISSLVAALTFATLGASEFRAFHEFGMIAALGMILLIAAYVLLLPPLIGVAARHGFTLGAKPVGQTPSGSTTGRIISGFRRQIGVGSAAVALFLGIAATRASFDYDFASLEDASLPSFWLDREVNRILGYSQTPVVVLTDSEREERAVVGELVRRKAEKGDRSTLDFVAALGDLVPSAQQEKQAILASIGKLLEQIPVESLEPSAREDVRRLARMTRAEPFSRSELPEDLRRRFLGRNSDPTSGFVLVYPRARLSEGDKVREFAREVRDIPLPGGRISAAGEPMILADVLDMVTREAGPILLGTTVAVLLAMWATLGNLAAAVTCFVPTLVSLLATVGLMALLGFRFNYLNVIVVPVLIGVTIDGAVHLLNRFSESGEDFFEAYRDTGRAITGGLLTSAIGFGALLLATHPGLASIGKIAVLGLAANLVVLMISFPAVLLTLAGSPLSGRIRTPMIAGSPEIRARSAPGGRTL